MGLFDAARAYFLVPTEDVGQERRRELAAVVDRIRQKREAAETLWLHGSRAEALALATSALDLVAATKEAAVELPRVETLPVHDDAVAEPERRLFRESIDALRAAEDRLVPLALDERGRLRVRVSRAASALLIVFAALLAAGAWVRKQRNVRVVASSQLGLTFQASNVLDGNEASEWLLPDGTPGWIELQFPKPRTVRALRLLNASNRPGPDRAVTEYTIEVWSGGNLVHAVAGNFGSFQPTPTWQRIDFGTLERVTRVRFTVRGWAGMGGGLAELRVE